MRASKIRVNCGGWTTRWRKRGPLYIDCRGVVDRDGDWGHFCVKIKEFFKKWLERDYPVNGRFLSLDTFIISKIEVIYRNLSDRKI